MDKETKSVQGTEGRSIRNKLEFSGRTVVSGMKKTGFRDGRGFDRTNSQRLGSANDVNWARPGKKIRVQGAECGKGVRYQRLGAANDVNWARSGKKISSGDWGGFDWKTCQRKTWSSGDEEWYHGWKKTEFWDRRGIDRRKLSPIRKKNQFRVRNVGRGFDTKD